MTIYFHYRIIPLILNKFVNKTESETVALRWRLAGNVRANGRVNSTVPKYTTHGSRFILKRWHFVALVNFETPEERLVFQTDISFDKVLLHI